VLHHPRRLSQNLLRIGAAALIPETLQEQGISADIAFWRAGLGGKALADSESAVPIAWLGRAFKSAAAAAAQPEFGLLVGLRAGARTIDRIEGSARSDRHVSSALIKIISRQARFPDSLLTLSVSGHTCSIDCAALPCNLVARDQLEDCAMGFAAGALRTLCGPHFRPLEFRFVHGKPPDPLRQAALLQASACYDADVTTMEFELAWLGPEYAASRGLPSRVVNMQKTHRDPVAELRVILASSHAIDVLSAPAAALELGLTPRALNRLLAKEGTNFHRVLEDSRYESARRLLRNVAAPIVSIAWALGYADASAFSRAFRRWAGVTPTAWRESDAQEL
jgi:AraC-like DNA-binding protein